jgi:hypothetical protein
MAIINTLVEGDLDEAAALKLILTTKHEAGVCYGKRGCGYIKNKIKGFNQAAATLHCLTLVDLMDTDISCSVDLIDQWLPHRNDKMIFRVVVRELESWFIADDENLATFLGIDRTLVPLNPEELKDPKRELVKLASRSRIKQLRSALVPEAGSTAQVGKLYNSEMKRFINSYWDLEVARKTAPSLDRCLRALEALGPSLTTA